MSDILVAGPDGTFAAAKALYVADQYGVFQPVRNSWVADAGGDFRQFWPSSVYINNFVATKTVTPWVSATISWDAVGATSVALYIAGTTTLLYKGTASAFVHYGVPGQTYKYQLRAYTTATGAGIVTDSTGSYSTSEVLTHKLDAMPAPANFKKTGGTAFGAYYTWNAVPGAGISYEVVDAASPAKPVKATAKTGIFTTAETGLAAHTNYQRSVRAKLGNVVSPLSAKALFTTPIAPGTAPGAYFFKATNFDVWAPGWSGWRGNGNGVIHGNGDNWGGNNGDNATFFFYDVAALRALSGRVTGFAARIRRESAAGISSPQLSRWWLHTYSSRPGGAPNFAANATVDSGSLAWGQDELVALPLGWGQCLVDGAFDVCGLVWGGVPGRYMRGPGPAQFDWQGGLVIVIG